ncbi:MAG TPA: PrsW family glutamic-type intramembrane protease [Solirubrobacteraceae bacterium]|jgi:RsiW-degrading membrane proteinase PrsW (M82 family)|nr:PrsW family glutamic-type intramembrane protease [Solirubrobacteraceae bacterium]
MATLRWVLGAMLPILCFAELVRRTDPRREPRWLVSVTFALGAVAAAGALFVTERAAARTGLDVRVSAAGETGALVFLFLVVAPIQEAAKVAAAWPAFLSKHLDEAYDGVVYSAVSSLGFAAVENALVLRDHPAGAIWIARAVLALPAHVFFACLWGYALARAKQSKRRLPIFPAAFVATIGAHGLYAHFVYGRGPGALLAVTPLLAAMGLVAWMLARDLRSRDRSSPIPSTSRGRLSRLSQAPSLSAVRSALRRADEPVKIRWILLGALVTLGAMIVGLAAGVVAAHVLRIDLSTVNEHELTTAAPAVLLGLGLLGSFPTSGWLVARAANVRTLLEPALASVLALVVTLVALGFAAPFAVVFGLALSPIAWVLSCAGAWVAAG